MEKVKEAQREAKKEQMEIKKEENKEPQESKGPVRVFYPVINYDGCIKCMVCVKLCPQNVFEIKNGYPVVANPTACDPNCRICGVKCPTKTISFVSKIRWG